MKTADQQKQKDILNGFDNEIDKDRVNKKSTYRQMQTTEKKL